MANISIFVGLLLTLMGPCFYMAGAAGHRSFTAFIPSIFGVGILVCGLIARDAGKRKAAMHGAVMFGLLGFLGSLMGAKKWPALLAGQVVERPLAAWAQLLLFVICGIYVVLCVRSFIAARRAK